MKGIREKNRTGTPGRPVVEAWIPWCVKFRISGLGGRTDYKICF